MWQVTGPAVPFVTCRPSDRTDSFRRDPAADAARHMTHTGRWNHRPVDLRISNWGHCS